MSVVRSLMSVPALVLAMAGLAGCYDLSAPDGPRREDFTNDPNASEPNTGAQQQTQQAQAVNSEEAARAATKAVTAADPANANHAPRVDATAALPAGAEMSVAEYMARYIDPARNHD